MYGDEIGLYRKMNKFRAIINKLLKKEELTEEDREFLKKDRYNYELEL